MLISWLQRVYCPWNKCVLFQTKNASIAANFVHENGWHLETVRKNYVNYRAIIISVKFISHVGSAEKKKKKPT